jgi:hypothetical protein
MMTPGAADDAAARDAPALVVDVVSDIVCPWCFIGKRKLEIALADLRRGEPSLEVMVRWHSFQLNPDLPAEGIPRAAYLAQKFGAARATDVYARVKAIGETVGIPFRFDRIERQPNTLDGHRLVAWAQQQGDAGALVERLFSAYFIEGRFIGDRRARSARGGLRLARRGRARDARIRCDEAGRRRREPRIGRRRHPGRAVLHLQRAHGGLGCARPTDAAGRHRHGARQRVRT